MNNPLTEALRNLAHDQSVSNMSAFAKAFNKAVDESTWVYQRCDEDADGIRLQLINARGKLFAPLFSDAREILSADDTFMQTNINLFLDTVFHNSQIAGILVDPNTTSLCLEKSFLLRCLIHSRYPQEEYGGCEQRDWGVGIPSYAEGDLMTAGEIQNFAMHTVLDYEKNILNHYELVSGCDYPNAIPSLILEENGDFVFILVKGYVAKEDPTITADERKILLALCKRYNAKGFYAPVGFGSTDAERFDACLALRGDSFYAKYTGLQEIKDPSRPDFSRMNNTKETNLKIEQDDWKDQILEKGIKSQRLGITWSLLKAMEYFSSIPGWWDADSRYAKCKAKVESDVWATSSVAYKRSQDLLQANYKVASLANKLNDLPLFRFKEKKVLWL